MGWSNELFGCFQDPRLCIVTFLVPCYITGKNAEKFGENCILAGVLSLCGCPYELIVRDRLIVQKGVETSMTMEFVKMYFCYCCAVVQHARENGITIGGGGQAESMARE